MSSLPAPSLPAPSLPAPPPQLVRRPRAAPARQHSPPRSPCAREGQAWGGDERPLAGGGAGGTGAGVARYPGASPPEAIRRFAPRPAVVEELVEGREEGAEASALAPAESETDRWVRAHTQPSETL